MQDVPAPQGTFPGGAVSQLTWRGNPTDRRTDMEFPLRRCRHPGFVTVALCHAEFPTIRRQTRFGRLKL